jgi:TRAP-type C4-dicarboxylate transport system permease small subunit
VNGRFDAALGRVLDAASRIGGVLLFGMAMLIMADVITRWFTGAPLVGVFEANEVMLVAITFLVLGFVEHQHRQLAVDILTVRLRRRRKAASVLLDKLLSAIFYGLLTWLAAVEWWKAWSGGYLRRGLVEIPTVIPLGFIVAGALLTTLAALAGAGRAASGLVRGGEFHLPGEGDRPESV